jgi:hypothetical protein
MALPLAIGAAKLIGSTAAWYGVSEVIDRFMSSDTGKEEVRRQTKEISEAIQDPSIPEEEREILGSTLSSMEEYMGPAFAALGLTSLVAPIRKYMGGQKALPPGQKALPPGQEPPLTGPVMGTPKGRGVPGRPTGRPPIPVGQAAKAQKALPGMAKKLLPGLSKRRGFKGLLAGLLAFAAPYLYDTYQETFGEEPPEDDTPNTPETPETPEPPGPGFQIIPAPTEDPEEDTEAPETPSRRPRGGHPGNRRGRQGPGGTWRDDPPYPPRRGLERPVLPITEVPGGEQPEAPDIPGEPRLDELMPELANRFAPARPDKTRVVTDQRIGDPRGLDIFRKKPQPGTRPELPVTGVPEDQPEDIPDMVPTDQDIERLFNGEGMPDRFQDDPSKDAVSAAFLRERGKAFGGAQGQIEGAPPLYQEPEGVAFIDTPEGQAFLQQRMTPMSPQAQPSPGAQPEPIPRDIPSPQAPPPPGMPRPTLPMPEVEEDRPEDAQSPIQEDILDASARSLGGRPDPGPTDDDIIGLFEGRGVPVSQLSEEEAQAQLDDIVSKLEEEPVELTEEEEKRFRDLVERLRR